MSAPIITVENISKKYIIGQNLHGRGSRTFRDVFDHKLKRFFLRDGRKEKHENTIWALKDVSFEVQEGEVVGIIGRNGAGKSTLLKILSRITEPTKGKAILCGRVASLLEVGTGFNMELTGHENIYLNGAILGMRKSEIDRKFDDIVNFAEIEKFIYTPVKRYSSGMYLRLAFAVAAHLEPDILVIDEVLAVGDFAFQKKCLGKLENISHEGRTILFVSHNMAAVSALCSRGIVINEGKLEYDGQSKDAITYYFKHMIQSSKKSLELREDRSGNGKARFVDIHLEDINGEGVTSLWSGGNIRFRLTVLPFFPIVKPQFLLTIYSSTGQKLFHCSSLVVGLKNGTQGVIDKKTNVICDIDKLPLTPGEYYANIALYSQNDLVDHVEAAINISVQEGDYFGTGRIPNRESGIFLVQHEWFYQE